MRRIPLINSDKFALVDDSQYEKAMKKKWRKVDGYAKVIFPTISLHIFLFGKAPEGFEWDHRNRNRLDCQRHNLRFFTHSQNQQNKGLMKHNTTGFTGVNFDTHRGKFRARFRIGGRLVFLGYFSSRTKAARAYDEAVFRHQGPGAKTNFQIVRHPRLP